MQQEPTAIKFSTRTEFWQLIRQCLARSGNRIQLFDPDFSSWPLGASDVTECLRHFLKLRKDNKLEVAMHKTGYLEQNCPRFLNLLEDFSHAVECRVTQRNLWQLTDSFCIADQLHIVRRYHCDHFRGEATFDSFDSTQICGERFAAIWAESIPGLHSKKLGL